VKPGVKLGPNFDESFRLEGARVKMTVGFNYPWSHNRYGADFGPDPWKSDEEIDAEQKLEEAGKLDDIPLPKWAGTIDDNLKTLKDLGVTVVRMWILANGFVYGRPKGTTIPAPGGGGVTLWNFDPPARADRRFRRDFGVLLERFAAAEMRLVPSLLDFYAFEEPAGADGGDRFLPKRRGDIARDPAKTKTFYDTILDELLAESKKHEEVIEAWEVMNEPAHITNLIATILPKPHAPEVSESKMSAFLAEGVKRIEAAGFASTVGHRFFDDLATFPTGNLRQYHYYAKTVAGMGDPEPIPSFATANAMVGEIHAIYKSDETEAWPELTDDAKSQTVYQRLRLLLEKGYEEVLVWPDVKDPPGDELKLSAEQQASLRRFATGYFDKGMPPKSEPKD